MKSASENKSCTKFTIKPFVNQVLLEENAIKIVTAVSNVLELVKN